jgi:hypothetical protein
MLGYLVEYIDISMNLIRHPSMTLDPYTTSMYPTGHSSMALHPYVMSMYAMGITLKESGNLKDLAS